ncbi:MAG TPA: molybdopterin dinucleotide binding domain-containing protein, partial [Burkholderiales bacterium]|nr:molybdopterin dinucleotide binding domain-containing protein [Burkholderiales bacterium]
HAGEPSIGIHSADLARRGLRAGQLVHVESRRGRVTVAVQSDDSLQPGTASLAMHWGARLLGGADAAGVNALTLPVCDPVSFQPELKHCGVRVVPAKLEHRLVAFASARDADAVRLLGAASELLGRFKYGHCLMLPGAEAGVLLRVADASPIAKLMLDVIDDLFRVNRHDTLRYDDPRLGVSRRVAIADDRICAVRLSGDLTPEAWLKELFVSGKSVAGMRHRLLAPAMPAGAPSRGGIVCSCFNVAQADIVSSLARHRGGDALAALQRELKCGTQCGSCVPEVKQLIAASVATMPDIHGAVA